MKKFKKFAAILAASTCFTSALTGCQILEKVADEMVISMVEWDLNSTYLNQHNEEYLKLCDVTKEQAEADYLDGIAIDVENFCYYWGIIDGETMTMESVDPELNTRLTTLMDTISQKIKFEVQSASAMDDSSYSVKVVLSPIDIMDQANTIYEANTYQPLNDFWAKTETVDYDSISDEEYIELCNEYGFIILEMVEEQLPNLGYMDEKSLLIQVESVNDVWEFNEDDMNTFYNSAVYYPE